MKKKTPGRKSEKIDINLSENEKVDILLRKNLKEGLSENLTDIAAAYNIPTTVVKSINYDKLTPEGRALYQKRVQLLESKALALTEVAIEKGIDLVMKADDPKNLAGIAAIGKFADTIYRLENNKPTEITGIMSAEDHAVEFIKMLLSEMSFDEALDTFLEANLEPIIPDWRKEDIYSKIKAGTIKIPGYE